MAAPALDGLRVLEVGGGKALAYAGKLLRDLGAEVIKVEPPEGDALRSAGPFFRDEPDAEGSGLFIYLNAGKHGTRLDPESSGGRAAFAALADGADIVLHSFRPSEAARFGLDYESLSRERARLIVGAVTAFGSTGPYAEWRGYALQCYAGAAVGYRVGARDREPLAAALDGAELQHAAPQLVAAVLLALLHRDHTGLGQFVDVGILEAVNVSVWGHGIPQVVYLGVPQARRNGNLMSGGFMGVYPTKDGHLAMLCQFDRQWQAFLEILGNEELLADPTVPGLGAPSLRFNLPIEEGERAQALLDTVMVAELRKHTNAELWERTRKALVPFHPVLTIPQVCESEQARERGWLVDAPGAHQPLRVPGAPYRFSRTPVLPPGAPPRLDDEPATGWRSTPLETRSAEDARGALPLDGLRVLDLGQVWAGPLVARYLADFGADVVSVQTTTRAFASGVAGSREPETPLAWEWIQRNRRSILIDFQTEEGRALFKRLAAASDVVVENFGPHAMTRLGLSYDELAVAYPGLVMISMPAMGRTGPWADLLSYGPTLTALNGMKSLNGYPEDGSIMDDAAELDPIAAGYGTVAVLAALAHRNRTGRGEHIELAQAEAGFAGLAEAVIEWEWNGRDIGPVGNTHRTLAPHGVYPAAGDDQWIAIACGSEAEWTVLAQAAAHEEWLTVPAFATADARRAHRADLDHAIGGWTAQHDKWELTRQLQAAGVAAFPVLDAVEAVSDPMLSERRTHFELHPDFPGDQLLNGSPWHLSACRPRLRLPAPPLGAHNVEVFGEYLGMDEAEVHALEEAGVLR